MTTDPFPAYLVQCMLVSVSGRAIHNMIAKMRCIAANAMLSTEHAIKLTIELNAGWCEV